VTVGVAAQLGLQPINRLEIFVVIAVIENR